MKLKKFLRHKQYGLGIQFSETGTMALELCRDKAGLISGEFYSTMEACAKLKTKAAHASIPDLKVMKKTIALSQELTKADIKLELQINPSKYFPHIMDDLTFDVIFTEPEFSKNGAPRISPWSLIRWATSRRSVCRIHPHLKERSSAKADKAREIIIFAMRTSDVEEKFNQARQSHLLLSSLEPESYALLRIVFLYHKSFDVEKNYAALFCFQQKYRLIIFSKDFVIDEYQLPLNNAPWQASDLELLGRILRDHATKSSGRSCDRCFIIHVADIPSDFISGMSEILNCEAEGINPFRSIQCNIPDNNKSDAMILLGLALRGLND